MQDQLLQFFESGEAMFADPGEGNSTALLVVSCIHACVQALGWSMCWFADCSAMSAACRCQSEVTRRTLHGQGALAHCDGLKYAKLSQHTPFHSTQSRSH